MDEIERFTHAAPNKISIQDLFELWYKIWFTKKKNQGLFLDEGGREVRNLDESLIMRFSLIGVWLKL